MCMCAHTTRNKQCRTRPLHTLIKYKLLFICFLPPPNKYSQYQGVSGECMEFCIQHQHHTSCNNQRNTDTDGNNGKKWTMMMITHSVGRDSLEPVIIQVEEHHLWLCGFQDQVTELLHLHTPHTYQVTCALLSPASPSLQCNKFYSSLHENWMTVQHLGNYSKLAMAVQNLEDSLMY